MVVSLLRRPALALALLAGPGALAQTPLARPAAADTVPRHKYENPAGAPAAAKRSFFRSKGFRAAVVPAVLIGYGASVINGHGWYSSYDAKRDIRRGFGTYRNHVDNYLQYAPYLELGGLLLAGVDARNDRVNLALVVLKGEALMLGSVFVVKTLTGVQRPDSSDRRSFPSGHTAQAFLAASLVHAEFRDKSPWYGIGAYALATGVGAFRMINNKHWESDVVAGAGFGILSAHLAYLTHRNRWGRKATGRGTGELGLVPAWSPAGGTGVALTWRAR
ncbi:MAG: phosphatase PAP2 family protein [Janthinobacterium lividum]